MAAVSPTNAHYEWSFFKPRIPLNMPVGFWVPAVKWCCFWQGLVSKWGIISLISVVWSVSHDILSVFSFYTLSEQSHSPGSSQWGCQRLPCAVKQQMAGQWKICSPNPWVHMGFRVKFQHFFSLPFERQTYQCALGSYLKFNFVQFWKCVLDCSRKFKNSVATAVSLPHHPKTFGHKKWGKYEYILETMKGVKKKHCKLD